MRPQIFITSQVLQFLASYLRSSASSKVVSGLVRTWALAFVKNASGVLCLLQTSCMYEECRHLSESCIIHSLENYLFIILRKFYVWKQVTYV